MTAGTPLTIVACPLCHYGFRGLDNSGTELKCPRSECNHQWMADGETIRAVHGTERRRAVFELTVTAGAGPFKTELHGTSISIGRDTENAIVLDSLSVSRRHAEISLKDSTAWIYDLGSSCGTAVNGTFIQEVTELFPRDRIMLGGATLQLDVRFEAAEAPKPIADNARLLLQSAALDVRYLGEPAEVIPITMPHMTFGRASDRNIIISGPLVSARHAVLERSSEGVYLSDVQSVYGTYVNGRPIIRTRLATGDRIQIGPVLFRYDGDRLVRILRSSAICIAVMELSKKIGESTLLDNISLILQPGEFVGVVGPGGSGKTTLLNALSGRDPATFGDVRINGDSLYDEFECLRQNIGFVSRENAVHPELTVHQVLEDAASLRLPIDTTADEKHRLIREIMALLELLPLSDIEIARLSEGQLRQVCIGIELLSRPEIVFLDGATSGLDGGAELRLMRFFRHLTDQGSTVICKTHTMEHADLFHKTVVLAPGGRLAFFGAPQEMKAYFGIKEYGELYERMGAQLPETWQALFQSSVHQAKIDAELNSVFPTSSSEKPRAPNRQASTHSRRSPYLSKRRSGGLTFALQQCRTLIQRQVRILLADRTALRMMFSLPVAFAFLICLACQDVSTVDFLFVMSAIGFGSSMAAPQLIGERSVYRRERLVNLRIDAYMISKLVPLMVISSLQAAILVTVSVIFGDTSGSLLMRLLALSVAGWNGVGLGLLISSVALHRNRALSAVSLSMVPQLVLAGFLVALPDMNLLTDVLSRAMPARWALNACQIATFNGLPIDQDLLQESNQRSLRNLYKYDSLDLPAGRVSFLQQRAGQQVRLGLEYRQSIAVMIWLLALSSASTMILLRQQDEL